jgi:hypothetical protein
VYSGVSIGKTTELRGMKLILFVKQNYALCSRFWCYRPGPIWPRVIPASREINLELVRRQVTTYSVIGFSKKIDETRLMTGFFFSENSSNRGTNGPTGRYSISSIRSVVWYMDAEVSGSPSEVSYDEYVFY